MNIIVTGGSRGIGYETVKILVSDPANMVIALARDKIALVQLKVNCNSDNLYTIVFDLAKESIKEKLLPLIQKYFTNVDILINNAGAIVNKSIQSITDEEMEYVYNVNVFSVFKLIRDLIPMLKQKTTPTHIVNISSMGGVQGSAKFPGLSIYSSSKGALAVLTECMAEELKSENIVVNCLAIGSVQTKMLEEAFPGYKANVSAKHMATFIANFALTGQNHFNGKILPVSIGTP